MFTFNLEAYDSQTITNKQRYLKYLNFSIPSLISIVLIFYTCAFTLTCIDPDSKMADRATLVIDYFSFAIFGLLGVLFIIIGAYLKRKLKHWNEEIELLARKKINFAICVLAIPFMFRSTYILIRIVSTIDQTYTNSILNDTVLAPILMIVVVGIFDLIPITSQLASMLVVIDNKDRGSYDPEESFGRSTYSEYSYYKPTAVNTKGAPLKELTKELSAGFIRINNSKETREEMLFKSTSSLSSDGMVNHLKQKSPEGSSGSDSD